MQDYRPNPNGSFNNQPQRTDYREAYQSTAIDTRMDEETLVLAGAGERIGIGLPCLPSGTDDEIRPDFR